MDVAVWAVVAGVVAWKFAGKAAQLVSGTFVALLGTVVKAAVLIAPVAAVAGRLMPGGHGGLGVLWAVVAAVVVVAGWWPAHVIRRELWPARDPAGVRWRRRREYLAAQWAAGRADAERWSDAVSNLARARVRASGSGPVVGVPGVLPGGRGGAERDQVGEAGSPGDVRGEPGAGERGGAAGGVLGGQRPVGRGPGAGGAALDLAELEERGQGFRAACEAAGIRV